MNALPAPLRAALPAAARALEATLNRLLDLDPDTCARLAALSGRRVQLRLDAPAIELELRVEGSRLRVGPTRAEPEPDLSLRTTLGALVAQLLPGAAAPGVGRMRISGDAELAQQLQRLARGFDPDFDAAFAAAFGELLGPQLARVLREGLRHGSMLGKQAGRGAVDYLVEERRDLVSRGEQEAFFEAVDELRDAVERLEARVARRAAAKSGAR
jgi:ubiquinone biosynthesis protein UbiJ